MNSVLFPQKYPTRVLESNGKEKSSQPADPSATVPHTELC